MPPFYSFKHTEIKSKAQAVLRVFLNNAYTSIKFKASCLIYRMRVKTIYNRFKMSKRIKEEFFIKLKTEIERQFIKMVEYDNSLPNMERICMSKKSLFFYKNEDLCLNFIIDFNKLLFLKEAFDQPNSVFDGKRLISKYQSKYSFMARVWKRYEQKNYRYEAYIEKYDAFIESRITDSNRGIFKTEVLNIDNRLKETDSKIRWDVHLIKDSAIMKRISSMDLKKLIFELVGFQKMSMMMTQLI